MNMRRGPKLNDRTGSSTNRDNLGITGAQTTLQTKLCPVINTVTYRAFYWPFLIWNYYDCIQNCTKQEISQSSINSIFNTDYVKKNDHYFILGMMKNKESDRTNLAGIDYGITRIKEPGPYEYDKQYLQAPFGGMQYYPGGCYTLGFTTDREQDGTSIPGLSRLTESIGKPMGFAFEKVIKETQYYKHYRLTNKTVPESVVEELGKTITLDMKNLTECKELLKNALFVERENERFSNKYLIQSRDFLLFLHDNHGLTKKPTSKYLRNVLYDWFSPRAENKTYLTSFENVIKSWEAVVGRQYFTIAIELICKVMIESLEVPKSIEMIRDDVVANSDIKRINTNIILADIVPEYNLGFEERELMVVESKRNTGKALENACALLFSIYNRFKVRDDIDSEDLSVGEPISITHLINKIDELWERPLFDLIDFIMEKWIIEQNQIIAFDKLMAGRNGYMFEQVGDYYKATGRGPALEFQDLRLVNLFQILKDLDYFE